MVWGQLPFTTANCRLLCRLYLKPLLKVGKVCCRLTVNLSSMQLLNVFFCAFDRKSRSCCGYCSIICYIQRYEFLCNRSCLLNCAIGSDIDLIPLQQQDLAVQELTQLHLPSPRPRPRRATLHWPSPLLTPRPLAATATHWQTWVACYGVIDCKLHRLQMCLSAPALHLSLPQFC